MSGTPDTIGAMPHKEDVVVVGGGIVGAAIAAELASRGASVTVVDKVVKKHGTADVAKAYLEYLYSDEGQDIAGKNFYRPTSTAAAAKYAGQFVNVELFTIDAAFGGWAKAQKTHFADGGTFDQIYAK